MAPSNVIPGSIYRYCEVPWRHRVVAPLPKDGQEVIIVRPSMVPDASMSYCFVQDAETREDLGLVPLHALGQQMRPAVKAVTTIIGPSINGEDIGYVIK